MTKNTDLLYTSLFYRLQTVVSAIGGWFHSIKTTTKSHYKNAQTITLFSDTISIFIGFNAINITGPLDINLMVLCHGASL
jgi:hypothetical protein